MKLTTSWKAEGTQRGFWFRKKGKCVFLIIRETDYYIVTRGLSDLFNRDS